MAVEYDESLELNPKNVVNAIAEVVHWYLLGIQLDIKHYTLDEIKEDNHSIDDSRMKMVIKWFEQDSNASWPKLVQALRSPVLKNYTIALADQIENKYVHRRGSESDMSTCSASMSSSGPSSPLSPISPDHRLEPPSPNFPASTTLQSKKAIALWEKSLSSVKGSFSKLCIVVAKQLQVDIQELCSFVNGILPIPIPRLKVTTTMELFDSLRDENVWDYWNHFSLEEIILKYGDAEMETLLEEHKIKLSGHLASVKIAECLANDSFNQRHYKRLRRNLDELKWKLGDVTDEALEFIDKLWKSLQYLSLPRKDAVLDRIQDGCVMVVWLISPLKSNEVCEKAKSNTELFEHYNVLWIKINDETIYQAESSLPETESEEVSKKTNTGFVGLFKSAMKPVKQLGQWIQKKRLDLVGACKSDNVEAVVYILEQEGVNVNARDSDKYGWTPIMWACENGNFELVEILIQHGADVNVKAKENYWTSLIIASQRGHLKIVQLLLDHNADVDAQTRDGSCALIWALYNEHVDISRLLVERGANVNVEEKNGWSPIIRASNKGLIEMVDLLCDRGADVNHPAERGWTALMAATNHNHKEVVDLLIERGADPNLRMTDTNEPAIHVASYRGHTEIAKTLLKANTDKNACNKEGLTTLMVATNRGHLDMVDALIEGGVDIDQPHEETGWTALFLAAKAGKLDMFKKLLRHGASTEIQGMKVEDVASYFKRNEILKEVKKIRQRPPISLQGTVIESSVDKPETTTVDVETHAASTSQDKSDDRPEEVKTEIEAVEVTDTKPVLSQSKVTHDKDAHSELDTRTLEEKDTVTDVSGAHTETRDEHPPKEDDTPRVEPEKQVTSDNVVSPPDNSTTEVAEQEIEPTQESTTNTVAVQPTKSLPNKDFKLNAQIMEQIMKAFEKRIELVVSKSGADNRQKNKGLKSTEEITHEQTIITT